jgi:2-amino-4-hydroxy-6-hydroxymethyldihydropteridine diphosphokinase
MPLPWARTGGAATALRPRRSRRRWQNCAPSPSPALGPAGRGFANAVAIVESKLEPDELLAALKALERGFGRRPGRRWGPRVLDLDIILWSEGPWDGPAPIVPHPEFRNRAFVLKPLAELAPDWRDPLSGLTFNQ